MVLRSASSPLLTSAAASSSSTSTDLLGAATGTATATATCSPPLRATSTHRPHHLSFSSIDNNNNKIISKAAVATSSSNKLSRTLSDGNLLPRRRRSFSVSVAQQQQQQQQSKIDHEGGMNSRLTREFHQPEEKYCAAAADAIPAIALVMGDGCAGGGGMKICKGHGEDSDYSDPHRNSEMSYQRMIEADPANSMILGNYARFLKDVRRDVARAKEMCERAIVASSSEDAGVICFYAEMIWETSKDLRRAETYFDRAVKAAPDDCYVMASYAHFLWESEEQDQEEEEVVDDDDRGFENLEKSQFVWGSSPPSAVTAAS